MPQQPYDTPVPSGGAKPFRVALPESLLADLRERLDRTCWPDEIPGSGWSYGTSLSYARELATYWKDEYDWRAQEAKLNAFEHYSAHLKGIDLHFIHERGDGDDSVPILLLHSWPSSVWEFHKIIHLLTYAGERVGFSVVAPSLPGYGFSFRPFQDRFGLVDCADALSELMTGALGYEEYVIAAGDREDLLVPGRLRRGWGGPRDLHALLVVEELPRTETGIPAVARARGAWGGGRCNGPGSRG